MIKCQHTKLTLGVNMRLQKDCNFWAEHKVTQLGTGDTVLVCRRHMWNYLRREDLFKVEPI